jgi:endonuclease/exonuclease/phosphatase family metal-dependent hydrolase
MRLLSYNIHKGVGGADRRYRLDRVVDVIRGEQPDLVCLQEVDWNVKRSRYDDQPDILADKLRAHASLYQLNHPRHQGGYGNLILSRWPLLSRHQLSLRFRQCKNRGAQVVVVDTPEGHLRLVNWHLGLGERERHWQVNHLIEHDLFEHARHLPTLIAGDFNDWRDTLGPRRLAPHGFEQVTAPTKHYRSFPAFFPLAALDKVYRQGPVRIETAGTVRHKQARQASDHLPLVVDFRLEARPGA